MTRNLNVSELQKIGVGRRYLRANEPLAKCGWLKQLIAFGLWIKSSTVVFPMTPCLFLISVLCLFNVNLPNFQLSKCEAQRGLCKVDWSGVTC